MKQISPGVCLPPRRSRKCLILEIPARFSQPRLVQRPFRNRCFSFKAAASCPKCRRRNVIKPKMLTGSPPRRRERFTQVGEGGGNECTCPTSVTLKVLFIISSGSSARKGVERLDVKEDLGHHSDPRSCTFGCSWSSVTVAKPLMPSVSSAFSSCLRRPNAASFRAAICVCQTSEKPTKIKQTRGEGPDISQ